MPEVGKKYFLFIRTGSFGKVCFELICTGANSPYFHFEGEVNITMSDKQFIQARAKAIEIFN